MGVDSGSVPVADAITIDALEVVAYGRRTDIGLVAVEELLDAAHARSRTPIDELTPREREVLALMSRGKSNRAIAEDLTLTKRAVEKHVGSIFMKLMLEDEDVVSRRVAAVLVFLAGMRVSGVVAEPFLTSVDNA